MLALSRRLAACALILALAFGQSQAFTGAENLGYIEKILGHLNNKDKCEMPTYEEIDDLQTSFNELKSLYGPEEFGSRLTPDQKLVLDTILDQWNSFQKYLTGESVTKTAKKRAFLGKVEKYQEEKHGFSICTQHPDDRAQREDDGVYEKNPLVRYVKQLQTDGPAVDAPASEESNKAVAADGANSAAAAPAGPRGGPNGNDPFADEPDFAFKFKIHPKDPKENVRQYAGKFSYRDGARNPHKISLNVYRK